MFVQILLGAVSLMTSPSVRYVSGNCRSCADPPVFTPSSLVVKHGSHVSVSCVLCKAACLNSTKNGLEASVGNTRTKGIILSWDVVDMTEWDISAMCYYTTVSAQCCTTLSVTVYQPPDEVSMRLENATGPAAACGRSNLRCTVRNVAPIESLTVTFYRGQKALGRLKSNNTDKEPVTEVFTLENIRTSNRGGGGGDLYWCEAVLELGSEGPQPPPVVRSSNVSAPDNYYICPNPPMFTPSTLVVKYGGSASATCTVCKDDCQRNIYKLETSIGKEERNGTLLTWRIDRMDQWDTEALCFYSADSEEQCCKTLPVIVYQPPDVLLKLVNHTGPMVEDREYVLECTVRNVAPVKNLIVIFYKDNTVLDELRPRSEPQKEPVTEVFTHNINASKEDDGARYHCTAALVLEPEGPNVDTESEALQATVHYGPHLELSASPEPLTITKGDTLHLNCSAVGNPPPSYAWTLPSNSSSSFNGSVLTIASVTSEHGGGYVCTVRGNGRTVTVDFSVEVQASFALHIIIGVAILVALAVCCVLIGYFLHYKQTHMGRYDLKKVFCLHRL